MANGGSSSNNDDDIIYDGGGSCIDNNNGGGDEQVKMKHGLSTWEIETCKLLLYKVIHFKFGRFRVT